MVNQKAQPLSSRNHVGSVVERSPRLVDPHGRWIHKLRVQITDACNFRCFYCMPDQPRFMPPNLLLKVDPLVETVRHLVAHGIDEVRVTGGEPTLRPEFAEIMEKLSDLPMRKLGLTTNGFLLDRALDRLRATRLRHSNISLDSLEADNFRRITKTRAFKQVMRAILRARDMGFTVKINCLLFRGRNDHELADFVRFSAREGLEVRFLEYMRIGSEYENHAATFLSAGEAIERLEKDGFTLLREPVPKDSTSFNFRTPEGATIGFIASETQPFCQHCSRLRLTATGMLRSCLMAPWGKSLRDVPVESIGPVIAEVMAMKPTGRRKEIKQDMYTIGG